jgi:hypothetical protein
VFLNTRRSHARALSRSRLPGHGVAIKSSVTGPRGLTRRRWWHAERGNQPYAAARLPRHAGEAELSNLVLGVFRGVKCSLSGGLGLRRAALLVLNTFFASRSDIFRAVSLEDFLGSPGLLGCV